MRSTHEQLLDTVFAERRRVANRRELLLSGTKVVAGGALALSVVGMPGLSRGLLAQEAGQDVVVFGSDIEVLNYALTLEHLEYAFYRDGIGQFQFGLGPFDIDIDTYLADIRDHELAHVETLSQVITDLGGEPVAEVQYDFGYTDAQSFLETAQALENTGVRAYDGAGQFLSDPGLLTAAGTIVAVEARHAAYLNLINGDIPFPEAFEDPATPAEVLAIAGQFIVA